MGKKSISELLAECLSPRIQSRGETYYRTGRVERIFREGFLYTATVRGSGKDYTTRIAHGDPNNPGLGVDCSCPYFETHGICKHVYALALALDAGERVHRGDPIKVWQKLMAKGIMVSQPQRIPAGIKTEADDHSVSLPHYLISPHDATGICGHLNVHLTTENRLKSGAIRLQPIPVSGLLHQPGLPEADQVIVARLQALMLEKSSYFYDNKRATRVDLEGEHLHGLLGKMADTGRLHYANPNTPLSLEHLPAVQNALSENWEFHLNGKLEDKELLLRGELRHNGEARPLNAPLWIGNFGVIGWSDRITSLQNPEYQPWMEELFGDEPLRVYQDDCDDFLKALYHLPNPPPVDLPEGYALQNRLGEPQPRLRLESVNPQSGFHGIPEFRYGEQVFNWLETQQQLVDWENRQILRRDRPAELIALKTLESLGGHMDTAHRDPTKEAPWIFPPGTLATLVDTLDQAGWELQLRGARLRRSSEFSLQVESTGVDWFDVHGSLKFGDQSVTLPEIIQSMNRDDGFISLNNGGLGLIPEEIRRQLGLLERLAEGAEADGHYHFHGAQTVLLDMLLADQPQVDWDQEARNLRDRLRKISQPTAVEPVKGFQGTLRTYQKEGLGWMRYLREVGLNGCLADDMGLGKTVQVLALLEEQRQAGEGPFLAVLPKSLIFNWTQEANRFTPKMRVAELAGSERPKSADELPEADLYLTSYPTLLRDIGWLKDIAFQYVILDESQAIKNPAAKTTKAVRLLQGRHRLTLTGTPVENRLDDLWSQLNFLNPGMLGKKPGGSKDIPPETLAMISRSVRPFLLRRTKEQVAAALPEKVEETLYCDLPAGQRKIYNDLKTYYRKQLSKGIETRGLAKSKFMVLEALLRLRQVACHPGLVSEKHARMESAKLSALGDLLDDILSSGHKALIFSQFTSMLALVRHKLDRDNTVYAYLDGQTKDRTAVVERFQNDPDCPLFLISLKAGGVGLNLTAADYVILLDPWWNPAIEAQAIDRAHRIGQDKKVFAYRLVARDTIEEKILALQDDKRHLAESILTQENSLLSKLTPEDLVFLLG
ncbi:MAG: DEAD/DEAH box helicase [Kiritimatiellae bacterium]|nr:DEAD/DEAH box helicase [Kiritimatiellia bacterium]